jgi:hypothetical protein
MGTGGEAVRLSQYSSKQIGDKVTELSRLCEQAGSLEVFSRTIQLSQL